MAAKTKTTTTWSCDNTGCDSIKEMPQGKRPFWYYLHLGGPECSYAKTDFCSQKCLVEFIAGTGTGCRAVIDEANKYGGGK